MASVIYLVCALCLMGLAFAAPKSEKKYSAAIFVPIIYVAYECWECLCAGILQLLKLPVAIESVTVMNVLLALAIAFYIFKLKRVQKYSFTIMDGVAIGIFLVVAVSFAMRLYWQSLPLGTSGSAIPTRISGILQLFSDKSISKMPSGYFDLITTAFFMSGVQAIVPEFYLWKALNLKDITNLLLCGWMLYAIFAARAKTMWNYISAIAISTIFMLGLPRLYLISKIPEQNEGIIAVLFVICVVTLFTQEAKPNFVFVILAGLGCLGVGLAYPTAMPIVFAAVFLCVGLYYYKQEDKKKIKKMVITFAAIFVIPIIFAIVFIFVLPKMHNELLSLKDLLNARDVLYRYFYGDYLLYLPFAMYGVVKLCRKKEWKINLVLPILAVAVLAMLAAAMLLGMSFVADLYYELNILVMASLAILTYDATIFAAKESKVMLASGVCCVGVLAAMSYFEVDLRIKEQDVNNSWYAGSNTAFQAYIVTGEKYRDIKYINDDTLELYDKMCEITKQTGHRVILCGDKNLDSYYRLSIRNYLKTSDEQLFYNLGAMKKEVKNSNQDEYIYMRTRGNNIYKDNLIAFVGYDVVFENSAGKIFKGN